MMAAHAATEEVVAHGAMNTHQDALCACVGLRSCRCCELATQATDGASASDLLASKSTSTFWHILGSPTAGYSAPPVGDISSRTRSLLDSDPLGTISIGDFSLASTEQSSSHASLNQAVALFGQVAAARFGASHAGESQITPAAQLQQEPLSLLTHAYHA